MKRIFHYLPVLLASASCVPFASAQSTFDFNIGFGAVQDKAATGGIDSTTENNCTLGSSTTCMSTPALSGFMLGFGGNLMLWKHFGAGVEYTVQPSRQNYFSLSPAAAASEGLTSDSFQTRATFYDFNGIFQPYKSKKASIEFSGGIGGANFKIYEKQSLTTGLLGTQSQSGLAAQPDNDFQVHAGAGVQIYLTDKIFIRPQFDIHYVPNLNRWGSKVVTEEMVWVGYSFGGS